MPEPMRTVLLRLSLPLLAVAAACSGGEIVGVHVKLAADGSGVVTTRALSTPNLNPAAETRTAGVEWTLRAALISSQGTFRDIAALRLGDGGVTFQPQLGGDRPGLRVQLKRGPGTPWIEALVPDLDTRRRTAKAYDPTGKTSEIADVLRIEIETPGAVLTSGVLPSARGVEAASDGKRAYLLLPVRTALEAGDDFVWDVSWL